MASQFSSFEVKFTDDDITETLVPDAPVEVRDVTDADPITGVGAIRLDDIAADASGHVATGTVDVAVGRKLRFTWYRDEDGRTGTLTKTTTTIS